MRYTKSKILEQLRGLTNTPVSCGLSNSDVEYFLEKDPLLGLAITQAKDNLIALQDEFPELTKLDEKELLEKLPKAFLNFYPPETASPYVPIGAKGPWIITYGGGVIYDTGGYGMLGQGHDPDCIREVMSKPQVMANIMTPSFAQHRFSEKIKQRIGHLHSSKQCPYDRFICMNSGSEGMGVALRISDAHAHRMTKPGGKHEGKQIRIMSFEGSFHGRTKRAAFISNSTRDKYLKSLASFQNRDEYIELRVNDIAHLEEIYRDADSNNIYIETLALEPVMGEGNPGQPLDPEFYKRARELTREHDTFLIIDSIQAGLRAQGVLSVIDYPGFEECEAPDMEIYSKALNGGQYPLSVLAMQQSVADEYVSGTYGNTMTAAPRALDVASKVLDALSPSLTKNVREKGKEFVEKLEKLKEELPGMITKVQGTGLLVSAELRSDIPVIGFDAVEQQLRKSGMNVIHGGENSLRFTPWLLISSEEIDLIVRMVTSSLKKYSS